MKYPLGIQSFEKLRSDGYLYLDKTALVYDQEFEMYRLGFPNQEVERGFTRFLIPYYTNLKSEQGQFFVANFVKD